MIEKQRIERIITAGICAPSGDNSQPWSFHIESNTIDVFAHPDEDHALLNIEGRGTYLATGALIENMVVAAGYEGLSAYVALFPEAGTTARITLSEQRSRGHHQYDAIHARHTHRGVYDTRRNAPVDALKSIREPHCKVVILTDRTAIRTIAHGVSVMEETALSVRKLHALFFDSIIWDKDDNASGAPGLFIRTTELPAPIQGLFRLIRHWPVQQVCNMLGLPKLAAKSNADVYERSAALLAVIVDRTEAEDFINAGRCMQRAWLELTARGLAAQPLAGLLYLAEYLERTSDEDFKPSIVLRARDARATIEDTLGVAHGSIAMLMRCGYPHAPATARSCRRAPRFV